jgi:galactokinase
MEPIPDWTADPETRAARIAECFRERFAAEPELWARAPGRVDLMGSHTDYNLGFVLTLPISRDAWIGARRRDDRTVRVHSMNLDAEDEFRLDAIDRAPGTTWRNYVRGVAAVLQNEGFALTGCDATLHSTVPTESGLSSSAALESAVATMFAALGGVDLTAERKALLCQKAENEFVGVKCGILDQYSSCLGREGCALLLDCRDLSTRAVWIAAGIRIVVCNTMSPRRLSGGEYAQRRAECEQAAALLGVNALRDVTPEMLAARRHELPEGAVRRAQFIVAESLRAESLACALSPATGLQWPDSARSRLRERETFTRSARRRC